MRAAAHRLEAQTGGRPPGFVHIDLDGLWTLAGCYGYPEGESFNEDPVFAVGLARLLGLLDELGIKATVFIVGRDLEHPAKAMLIRDLVCRGHEPAVHGWSHAFGLESLDDAQLDGEIGRTAQAIESASGQRPLGFRAPGYAAGPRTLAAVSRAGLRYDGSMLPTRFGWLLRAMVGRLRARVRRELTSSTPPILSTPSTSSTSSTYGGGGGGGLDPFWAAPEGPGLAPVLRLPLAVSPWLRVPLHASLGILLGEPRVTAGLRRLARRGQPITYLLHGMDALGPEDLAGRLPGALARTRPFQISLEEKFKFLRRVLGELKAISEVQLTREWIERLHAATQER